MRRRGFLTSLAGFAVGMTLDTERLLWVRGAKTISIPKASGYTVPPIVSERLDQIFAGNRALCGIRYFQVATMRPFLGIQRTGHISNKPMRVPFCFILA